LDTLTRAPAPAINGVPARWIVGATIGVAFMGSGLIAPLYAVYQRTFHFPEVTLTLIYAAYALGNLAALLFFGKVSDCAGRRIFGAVGALVALTRETVDSAGRKPSFELLRPRVGVPKEIPRSSSRPP
jgi:MFS family permease